VSSVLVIASDPNIESLVGELVGSAGHRPVYDVTVGAGGESIRRVRPDVVLLDTSLPRGVLDACVSAADEVRCPPVLMSSMDSTIEMAEHAHVQHCLRFALPDGLEPLAEVLERAIAVLVRQPTEVFDCLRRLC
jgi:DNA-binding NtrC family response regulator